MTEPNQDAQNNEEQIREDEIVFANMNVEGLPWYNPDRDKKPDTRDRLGLSAEGKWAAIFGVMKATILIGGAYFFGFLLVILFIIYVWGR